MSTRAEFASKVRDLLPSHHRYLTSVLRRKDYNLIPFSQWRTLLLCAGFTNDEVVRYTTSASMLLAFRRWCAWSSPKKRS